jgi:hypothetical protein
VLGPIAFEVSVFAVDGRTDLSLLVYNPTTTAGAEQIASLLDGFQDGVQGRCSVGSEGTPQP